MIDVVGEKTEKGKAWVQASGPHVGGRTETGEAGGQRGRDMASSTPPQARDREAVARLDAVAGRVLGG